MKNVQLMRVFGLAALASSPVLAQTSPTTVVLEEIIVTAAKRPQTLQDIPISVSVTDRKTLEQAQIRDLIDLQSVVPSLKVVQLNAVGQTNFIIRGFGNGNGNDGIESSVGVFIDGVYRSRTSSALDDLSEVERIEVLRGPQSTLFGKNVSAGAINIVTARPKSEFGANAELGFGNFGLVQGKASLTGPLTESLSYRLSGTGTQRDGLVDNLVTGSDVNDRDRWSVRGDLLWRPSANVTARIIADYNEITETCCGVVSIRNGPATQLIAAPAPIGLGRVVSDPNARFDEQIIFSTDPTNRLTGEGISAQFDVDLDFGTVTSISAYRNQKNQSFQDVDFTGADIANKDEANDISTFTQEFRLVSSGDGPISYLIGAFFQDESIDSGRDTFFGPEARAFVDRLSGQVPGQLLGALPPPLRAALTGQSNIFAVEVLQSLTNPAVTPGAAYFQAGQGIADFYTLDQRSFSIFSQFDFEVTEELTLTAGLAYLDDRKQARSNVVLRDRFAMLNLQNVPEFAAVGLPPNLFGPLGALQFFYGDAPNHAPVNFPNANESGELRGDKVTYALRASYDLFDAVNVYAGYSTGWKAGAVNLSSDSRPPDVNGVGRTAGPEDVKVYEIGAKTTFNRGFVTVALFDQSIEDFQTNAFTGTGFALLNAGEESVRGVELDAAYRVTNWLSLTGSATYLDPEYDSFSGAVCVTFDTVRCPINPATGRVAVPFRDLSGQRPAGIPRLSLSVSALLSHDFGNGFAGYLRTEYDRTSDTLLSETTPPGISRGGPEIVNASLAISYQPAQLEVMLWARNLTDDESLVATFPTVAQDGSFSAFVLQPRTYGLTIRKAF